MQSPPQQIVPPLLAEFTLRGTNPMRRLTHRMLPFLPVARDYRWRVKVRWPGHGWASQLLGKSGPLARLPPEQHTHAVTPSRPATAGGMYC